jgi:hypothetical protein
MLNSHCKPACNNLCPRTPPGQRTSQKEKDLFFSLFMHLPTVKQVQSLRQQGATQLFIF